MTQKRNGRLTRSDRFILAGIWVSSVPMIISAVSFILAGTARLSDYLLLAIILIMNTFTYFSTRARRWYLASADEMEQAKKAMEQTQQEMLQVIAEAGQTAPGQNGTTGRASLPGSRSTEDTRIPVSTAEFESMQVRKILLSTLGPEVKPMSTIEMAQEAASRLAALR